MNTAAHSLVRIAIFDVLPTHLRPFVEARLAEAGIADTWPAIVEVMGDEHTHTDLNDLSLQLRLLTGRFGGRYLVRISAGLASKLHEVRRFRNAVVHGSFNVSQHLAALIAVQETLRLIGATDGVNQVDRLINEAMGGLIDEAIRRRDERETDTVAVPALAAVPERTETDPSLASRQLPALKGEPDASCAVVTPQLSARTDDVIEPKTVSRDQAAQLTRPNPLDALSVNLWIPNRYSYAQALLQRLPAVAVVLTAPGHEPNDPAGTDESEGIDFLDPDEFAIRSVAGSSEEPADRTPPREYDLDEITITLTVFDEAGLNALSSPWMHVLDLPARIGCAGVTHLLTPEVVALSELKEVTGSVIRLELNSGPWNRVVTLEGPQVLPADIWSLAGAQDSSLAALATHVHPDDDGVTLLLVQVARTLAGALTRGTHHAGACETSDTDAPQDGTPDELIDGLRTFVAATPGAVDTVVAKALELLQDLGMMVVPRTGTWSESPVRVQRPNDLLESRSGCSLDLVLLLAAAVERCGGDPLLVLTRTSAYVGYWTEEHATDRLELETNRVANSVDTGQVRLIDAAAVSAASRVSVHSAKQPSSVLRRDGLTRVLSIRAARERGIAAMNQLIADVDESPQPLLESADLPLLGPVNLSGRRPSETRDADCPPRVTQWKRDLLDLSLRNRLLNRTVTAADEILLPPQALPALEDLINASQAIELRHTEVERLSTTKAPTELSHADAARLTDLFRNDHAVEIALREDRYDRRLQRLASDARLIVSETGANNLYLALGTLVWQSGLKEIRSPLILIPVRLSRPSRLSPFSITIDETGASTPNYTLIERFRTDLGLDLDVLTNPVEDESGVDIAATLDALRRLLVRYELPFRVEDTLHLGIFRFAASRLWKDLDDHWRDIARNPLVEYLIEQPDRHFEDPATDAPCADLDDLIAQLPTLADASQAQVIASATAGRTMVVQGPPGTGKSQTIANLIVHAIDQGKSVMFVAEKRAALDVVARRLDAMGVGDLVLDLHDPQVRREDLRRGLGRSLALCPDREPTDLRRAERQVSVSRRALNRYRDDLHDQDTAGFSFYGAHNSLLAEGESAARLHIHDSAAASITAEQRELLVQTLDDAADALQSLPDGARQQWGSLRAVRDVETIDKVLTALGAARHALAAVPTGLLDLEQALADNPVHRAAAFKALSALDVTIEDVSVVESPEGTASLDALLSQMAHIGAFCPFAFTFVGTNALAVDIESVRREVLAVSSARWGRRKKIRAALAPFDSYRVGGELPTDPDEVLRFLLDLEHLRDLDRLVTTEMSRLMPSFWRSANGQWSVWRAADRALARSAAERVRSVVRALADSGDQRGAVLALMGREDRSDLIRLSTDADTALSGLTALVPEIGAEDLLAATQTDGPDSAGVVRRNLLAWNRLLKAVEPLRDAGLADAADQIMSGEVPADDLPQAWEVGFAAAALSERREATSLARFTSAAHNQSVASFAKSLRAVRRFLVGRTLRAAVDRRKEVWESATGRVPGLEAQIRRTKRGGQPIRAMMEEYGDLIFALTPCVLVSPDSAARFFPPTRTYSDIVIFDEASQITVASAVGAMGRGRSVVVVGDSKQMPPTVFAQFTGTEDEEDELFTPDESILAECVDLGIKTYTLAWHYRSQVESLISFSNNAYYEGGLASFPSPLDARGTVPGYGISLRKVDGVFHRQGERGVAADLRRTNPVEARAVVDEVKARFEASPTTVPSLGIVTFNAQQRDIIERYLREDEDSRLAAALDAADGLFVKNLENVQGDERDTILFSVGFSKAANGEVPLNFGPLNRVGGERRFNVAITRARKEVVVFLSFSPSDLHSERSSSVGLKHLREYLDLADQQPNPRHATSQSALDYHREDVGRALRETGLEVSSELGRSSFKVDLVLAPAGRPDRPCVAVLLDGEGWHRRETVSDRDVLPAIVLTNAMHWNRVERIWLPEWIENRDGVIARLCEAVDDANEQFEADLKAVSRRRASRRPAPRPQELPTSDRVRAEAETRRVENATRRAVEEDARRSAQLDTGAPGNDTERQVRAEAMSISTEKTPRGHRTAMSAARGAAAPGVLDSGGTARTTARVPAPPRSRKERPHRSPTAAQARVRPGMSATRVETHRTETPAPVPEFEKEEVPSVLRTEIERYHAWAAPYPSYDGDLLDRASGHSAEARAKVEAVARAVVTAEAPIHPVRLCRLVAEAFGVTEVQDSHRRTITSVVETIGRAQKDQFGYVWTMGDMRLPSRVRVRSFRVRALDKISVEELHPFELIEVMRRVVGLRPDYGATAHRREALRRLSRHTVHLNADQRRLFDEARAAAFIGEPSVIELSPGW